MRYIAINLKKNYSTSVNSRIDSRPLLGKSLKH